MSPKKDDMSHASLTQFQLEKRIRINVYKRKTKPPPSPKTDGIDFQGFFYY